MNERWSRSVSSPACRRARSASNPRVRQRTKRPSRSCVRRSGRPTDSGRRFVEPAYGLRTGSTGVGSARCRTRPHLDLIWGSRAPSPVGRYLGGGRVMSWACTGNKHDARKRAPVQRKAESCGETGAAAATRRIAASDRSPVRVPPPTGRSPPGTARFRASPAGARRRTAQLRAARKRA